ncbi:MAG TPA: hypothetical protein VFT22_10755, partial [Kofleriaceae bacterium]|nr:hypothetical protein [Kofleriaceae bacterium]
MRIVVIAALAAVLAGPPTAAAQGASPRYVEPLTAGMALPATPLAGEHDARTVVANPGGLALIRGTELALALDLEDMEVATTGPGFGAFWARSIGGRIVPRLGVGLGLEWLRPARDRLSVDPHEPFRFTLGVAAPLSATAGVGAAWHHLHGDGALDGVDAVDLGVSARFGSYLAAGATLRDLATSSIAGAPVERRYEAEGVVRPLGSDVLEAALGGRIGETRGDVDGWVRASWRVARGVYLHGALESRARRFLADSAVGSEERDGRELRA